MTGKSVKAWALTLDGQIFPNWVNESRKVIAYEMAAHREFLKGAKIVRVTITEIKRKR